MEELLNLDPDIYIKRLCYDAQSLFKKSHFVN